MLVSRLQWGIYKLNFRLEYMQSAHCNWEIACDANRTVKIIRFLGWHDEDLIQNQKVPQGFTEATSRPQFNFVRSSASKTLGVRLWADCG